MGAKNSRNAYLLGHSPSPISPLNEFEPSKLLTPSIVAQYSSEGIVPSDEHSMLLLRCFLDNEASTFILKQFGKLLDSDPITSFLAITAYKQGSVKSDLHNDGLLLYLNHVKNGVKIVPDKKAEITLSMTSENTCNNHFETEDCIGSSCPLFPNGFDWYLKDLFMRIYDLIYQPYISMNNDNILKLVRAVVLSNSVITVNDFEYEKILGTGSFGVVALCRKISTGKQYAMKIQPVSDLERCHEDNGQDVSAECIVLANCSHPYILPLQYAFHDKHVAILVNDYYPKGDLSSYMRENNINAFPVERAVYYLTQLVSAVGYIHRKGYIHRDIKPGNLLLLDNGRILLADFGSVKIEEVQQAMIKDYSNGSVISKSMRQFGMFKNTSLMREKYDPQYVIKANNIVGTDGYMSPEIAYMMLLPESVDKKDSYFYTKAVDWWSVGATAHKLLTGKKPMNNNSMMAILTQYEFGAGAGDYLHLIDQLSAASYKDSFSASGKQTLANSPKVASAMDFVNRSMRTNSLTMEEMNNKRLLLIPQPVALPNIKFMSFLIKDLLNRLLDVNFVTRLGSGKCGTWNIQSHELFRRVDWDAVFRMSDSPPGSVKNNEVINRTSDDELDDGWHSLNLINENLLLCQSVPKTKSKLAIVYDCIRKFVKRVTVNKVKPNGTMTFQELASSINKHEEWCVTTVTDDKAVNHLESWKFSSKDSIMLEIGSS